MILEILEFIFQDFWHWLGTLIIVYVAVPWNRITVNQTIKEEK